MGAYEDLIAEAEHYISELQTDGMTPAYVGPEKSYTDTFAILCEFQAEDPAGVGYPGGAGEGLDAPYWELIPSSAQRWRADGSGRPSVSLATDVQDGEWHHLACVYEFDGGDVTLQAWADGVDYGSTTYTAVAWTAGQYGIGVRPVTGGVLPAHVRRWTALARSVDDSDVLTHQAGPITVSAAPSRITVPVNVPLLVRT